MAGDNGGIVIDIQSFRILFRLDILMNGSLWDFNVYIFILTIYIILL